MNIANILKYCPNGTKLYSTVHGEVTLEQICENENENYPIHIDVSEACYETLTKEGRLYENQGECVLFPSEKQRDWNKFRLPVKKGDIMMHIDGSCPFIASGETITSYPKAVCGISGVFMMGDDNIWTFEFYIPATKEVKKKLFEAIEKAGYRWNTETLKLEKIEEPMLMFKPFDKVLVRNDKAEKWRASLFSNYATTVNYRYACINARYRYCIHYEGNEYLLGTSKDK